MSTTGSSSDESVHGCDVPVPDSDSEGEDVGISHATPADSLVPATPVFSQHIHMPGHHVLIGSIVVDRNFIGIATWVISWFVIVPVNV